MDIVLLVRAVMLAQRPYKLTRLKEEAEKAGHNVRHVDFADLAVSCRSGVCEVTCKGVPFEVGPLVYWAFGWDDREAWDLARAVEDAGHRMYMPTGTPLSDKVSQAFLLAKAGVLIPDTHILSLNMLRRNGVAMTFPFVMKGRYGARGELVRWVDSVDAVEACAAELGLPDNQPFVLQTPVEPLGEDVRAFVIGGSVVAAMLRRACTGEFRANFSAGGSVESTQLTPDEERAVLAAARIFGAPHSGVDFIRSPQGAVILEVNMWPGLEGIETATGMNMAALLIEDMVRRHT